MDLKELWKRIVFNMKVNNTDDHLRNHGFLLTEEGWVLSPLYDVNPVPYGNELAINISENDNRISRENAISVAPQFGLAHGTAEKIFDDIQGIVNSSWEKLAKRYEISRTQIENMRPAFRNI